MLVLLIIPLLVSGYIIATKNLYHYYRLHRHEGQLLYLRVISLGFSCFIFGVLLHYLIEEFFLDLNVTNHLKNFLIIPSLKDNVKDNLDLYIWLFFVSFLTIFSAYFFLLLTVIKNHVLGYFYYRKLKGSTNSLYFIYSRAVKFRVLKDLFGSGSIDAMLYESIISRKAILINMESNKVYVGFVSAIGEPTEADAPNTEISIVPSISGYRNKDDLFITFTSFYSSISNQNYSIRIDASQVTHYSWFNRKEYELMLSRHVSSVKKEISKKIPNEPGSKPKKSWGFF
ncbi:hypothetical protein PagCFBP13505_006615 [Pantoea agglomerans]|uniref:hypothetical protein n=1 Tax=Enterobacter agglomerans TaxID=549 RepID=UPI0010C192F8|nr:hypothetical protein [Pantoea agglomerans]TKJ60594.1 hypothetical protein PagCFBP13505_00630 [Pantoea agglomerans]